MDKQEQKRQPGIGFVGMLLMAVGFCALIADWNLGALLIIIGAVILAYALFTGHLPFLGR